MQAFLLFLAKKSEKRLDKLKVGKGYRKKKKK